MAQKILGLDIQNDTISAVLVKSGLKGIRVEAHHSVSINKSERKKAVGDALINLLEPLNTSGAICAVSLPADHIFFRNIRLPFKEQKKIRQVLPFELEPSLLVSAENLIIDFTIITDTGNSSQAEVFAAGLDTSTYHQFLDMLAVVNVKPDLMTFSHFASALCWAKLIRPHNRFLLVHLDHKGATVFIIASNEIPFMRHAVIPASDVISPHPISGVIRHTLLAYESMRDDSFDPSAVILTGAGSKKKGLDKQLETELAIPVRKGALAAELPPGKKISPQTTLKSDATDDALSLVLIQSEQIGGINFSKQPFSDYSKWAEYKKSLITTGLLIFFICLMAFASLWTDAYNMEKRGTGLTRQITNLFKQAFPEVKTIVDPLQQMRVKIQDMKKRAIYLLVADQKLHRLDIIKEISILVPPELDTEITRFVLDEDHVIISGNTNTFNTVNEMKSRLESSAFFQEVSIGTANFNRSGKRVDFTLKIRL